MRRRVYECYVGNGRYETVDLVVPKEIVGVISIAIPGVVGGGGELRGREGRGGGSDSEGTGTTVTMGDGMTTTTTPPLS